jgi:hypothetical protein
MQIQVHSFPVDVLTPHYRIYGELRSRGEAAVFLNDEEVETLTIHDATLMPLRQGMRLGAVTAAEIHVPKTEPQVLILGGYVPEVKPLPKTSELVCFTDTYVLRGTFHMGMEVKVLDLFYVQNIPFFPVTKLDVFTLYPMAVEVKVMAELAYVQGNAVRAFYETQLAD